MLTLQSKQLSTRVEVRFAGGFTELLYIALRQRASERTDQNELFVAATFPLPRKLLFFTLHQRAQSTASYICLVSCLVLGKQTGSDRKNSIHAHSVIKKERRREKKGYFSLEKRPKGSFVRSFVTSLFAEREGERDFWNGSRKT